MTVQSFIAAAQKYWATYLAVAAVVFAAGTAAILLSPATYVSSARLMVSVEGSTTAAAYQNEEVATRRIHSYIPLLTSGLVTQRVIDRLGLPMAPSELAQEISATNVPPKTSLIDISVRDRSSDRAEQIADATAREFIAFTAAIETPTGEDSQKVHTTLVSAAGPAHRDPFEQVILLLLAALTALLLGAVAVWIRETRNHPIPGLPGSADDVEADDVEADDRARHRATDSYGPPPRAVDAAESN